MGCDMNYQAHYDRLIERARLRQKPEVYCENHHIVPKCLGGSDENVNLVMLTAPEHYVAHQLLVKLNPQCRDLIFAMWCMTASKTDNIRGNKAYAWVRKKYSDNHPMKSDKLRKIMSEHMKNRPPAAPKSIETRLKMSKSITEYYKNNPGIRSGENSPRYGVKGVDHPMFGKGSLISGERNGMFNRKGAKHPSYGSRWINNGLVSKKLNKSDKLKDGWVFGRINFIKVK